MGQEEMSTINIRAYETKAVTTAESVNANVLHKARVEQTLKLLEGERIDRILDVGVNDGYMLSRLPDRIEKFGVDFVRQRSVTKFNFKKANVEKDGIPYEDCFFDAIICAEIIEHLLNTEFLLEECSRVLKPHGILVLSTPNLCNIRNILLILLGRQLTNVGYSSRELDENSTHLRYFSPESIVKCLERNNFQVVKYTTNVIGVPLLVRKARKYKFVLVFLKKLGVLFPKYGGHIILKARCIK